MNNSTKVGHVASVSICCGRVELRGTVPWAIYGRYRCHADSDTVVLVQQWSSSSLQCPTFVFHLLSRSYVSHSHAVSAAPSGGESRCCFPHFAHFGVELICPASRTQDHTNNTERVHTKPSIALHNTVQKANSSGDQWLLKPVGPTSWQIRSTTRWKHPKLTEQGVTRVGQNWLGLLCDCDFAPHSSVLPFLHEFVINKYPRTHEQYSVPCLPFMLSSWWQP